MKRALSGQRYGVFNFQGSAPGSSGPQQLREVGYCEGRLEFDLARWKAVL